MTDEQKSAAKKLANAAYHAYQTHCDFCEPCALFEAGVDDVPLCPVGEQLWIAYRRLEAGESITNNSQISSQWSSRPS